MPEEPSQLEIPRTLEEFEGSENIVEPPRNEQILPIEAENWPVFGRNCLVIFPTVNQDKIEPFKIKFQNNKPKHIESCFFLNIPTSDDDCAQPCNGQGYVCARLRIRKAKAIFPKEYPSYLKDNQIGTIIIAAIESFFERENVKRPVDAAVVGMFNLLTGEMVTATSKGATLNEWFLNEAQRLGGFVDCKKNCLCMTAGEVVKSKYPGVDKADWHKFAVKKPRREFLKETIDCMDIPWGSDRT